MSKVTLSEKERYALILSVCDYYNIGVNVDQNDENYILITTEATWINPMYKCLYTLGRLGVVRKLPLSGSLADHADRYLVTFLGESEEKAEKCSVQFMINIPRNARFPKIEYAKAKDLICQLSAIATVLSFGGHEYAAEICKKAAAEISDLNTRLTWQ